MRRMMALVLLVVLLLAGGGLTVQISQHNNRAETVVPFLLKQTDNPAASPFQAVPWQAEQLFLLVGFVLFNLIGMAVTITVIMWFINRGVAQSKATGSTELTSPKKAEST